MPVLYSASVAALTALSFLSAPALASEGGATHYPTDINTIGAAYAPPPGTLELYNYTTAQWSHTLANNHGNETVPGFSFHADVDALRTLYTFKQPIGPFHFVLGGVLNINHLKLDVGPASRSVTNLGDIDAETLLSYHTPDHRLFLLFGLDTYAPTGRYNKTKLISTGLNYWSFDPNVVFTYHATRKITFNGQALLEFNTENNATHYQSGDMFNLDYGMNYRAFADRPESSFVHHLGFGIVGNYLKQFTDDTVDGNTVGPGGHRGEEFSIGPQVSYDWRFGGIAFKFEHDVVVRNRPSINAVWVQFAVPLLGAPKHG
ncbi:Protein involved in meta-pathway of phenol degradation [Salinisphaera sp. LB1]|nr:Protein involved in meta-pathway of phenol degradation [Salinisphaera sp. LB1]